jgi:hypothetical protein
LVTRHGAPASGGFQRTKGTKAIGALAHVQLIARQVDINPTQAAQLRCPQSGKDRGQQERPRPALELAEDRADFVRGWDVAADFEPLFGPF